MQKPPKVGPAEGLRLPSGSRVSPHIDPSGSHSGGPSRQASSLSQEVQPKGGPSLHPYVSRTSVRDTPNWCCTITGLLCICAILLFLVMIMKLQVGLLEKKTKEETALWQWKILTLTEILKELQIGKVPSCGNCKIQWVQQRDNCFLFRDRRMGWHSSQGFCQEQNANLAVPINPQEMDFLKFYSNKQYHLDPEISVYDKFWIGLAYDTIKGRWLWINGIPFNSSLYGPLDPKGCAYLQNEMLYSQHCSEVAKIICETKVQFG